jgi:hypothetical protein
VEVAIDYSSGVEVTLLEASFDPQTFYEQVAKELESVGAATRTINGFPGIVVPGNSDVDESNPASISFAGKGVEVTLYGQGAISEDKLLDLAASISMS